MINYIINRWRYNIIIKRLDKEYQKLFYEFTKNDYKNWDEITYKFIDELSTKKYKDINLNKHVKVLLFSQPECWLFFLKDKDFHDYVKKFWNNILELYENDDFENKNFHIILKLLNNIDCEKFKIYVN
jgi:hypothetical protein